MTQRAVVAERCLAPGMGRSDRAGRGRFSSARHHRASAAARSQGQGAGRGSRRVHASTITARARPLARRRSSPAIAARSLRFCYEGRHLYSLDGVRANHFLQRARLDLLLPLRGALGFGVSGEYFFRQSFYQDEDRSQLEYRYPAVPRVFHVEPRVSRRLRAALRCARAARLARTRPWSSRSRRRRRNRRRRRTCKRGRRTCG